MKVLEVLDFLEFLVFLVIQGNLHLLVFLGVPGILILL